MPIITLSINCELSSNARLATVERLTDITSTVLGKKRELTVVRIDTSVSCDFYIAGKPTNYTVAYLEIVITEGSNTPTEKTAWLKATWQMLSETLGIAIQPNYILVKEIPGDSWGYNGLSQIFRSGL